MMALMMSAFTSIAQDSDATGNSSARVYIVPVEGGIDGKQEIILRRAVREANLNEAEILIINMNTPGGALNSTMEIFDILDSFNGDTVTFVDDEAYSAGALIAGATTKIFMSPDSVIGAATAIMVGPGGTPMEIPEDVGAKFSSALRGKIRSKALKNGHNPAVFEAMIDMKKELIVDGQVICKEGEILTLTAQEAFKSYGDPPKPLLAAGIVKDIDELIQVLGYQGAIRVEIEPTGTEMVGAWLTSISPILLLVAMIGLYMEFKSPGFGVPGLIGIVAAGLYFLGGHVAGFSEIGWMIVFFVGVVLIFCEVLLFPGTFVLGVTGAVLIALSVTMAFLDYDPNYDPQSEKPSQQEVAEPQTDDTENNEPMTQIERILPNPEEGLEIESKTSYLKNAVLDRFRELGLVFAGFAVSLVVLAKVLPHTPFYSRIVSLSASGVESVQEIKEENDKFVGASGVTISGLRPGGKARFGKDVLDVISDDGLLDRGIRVKIIEFSNSTAVVVKDNKESDSSTA